MAYHHLSNKLRPMTFNQTYQTTHVQTLKYMFMCSMHDLPHLFHCNIAPMHQCMFMVFNKDTKPNYTSSIKTKQSMSDY